MLFAPIKPNQLAFGSLNANQSSTKSVNKLCNGSAPDPFGGGAYNLQWISTTPEKGSGTRDYAAATLATPAYFFVKDRKDYTKPIQGTISPKCRKSSATRDFSA